MNDTKERLQYMPKSLFRNNRSFAIVSQHELITEADNYDELINRIVHSMIIQNRIVTWLPNYQINGGANDLGDI